MPNQTAPTVHLTIADRVATLTLDDPRRRNAMTLTMVREILGHLEALEAARERGEVGALVVTGAPPAFSAGADLSHLEGATGAGAEEGLRAIYEGFLAIGRFPLPTIAAVNGAAVGAGVNLALVCDLRLAARSARLDCRFLDLGLHPGGGHTWMLQRIAGPQAAAATVLFGQRLDGEEMVRRGLAWEVVDDDALLPRAQELAARAASAPHELAVRAKATLRETAKLPTHGKAVERELGDQVWSLEQPFFAERMRALKEKIRRKG